MGWSPMRSTPWSRADRSAQRVRLAWIETSAALGRNVAVTIQSHRTGRKEEPLQNGSAAATTGRKRMLSPAALDTRLGAFPNSVERRYFCLARPQL
jgi:hypothetical protein